MFTMIAKSPFRLLPLLACLLHPAYPASEETLITVEQGRVELSNDKGSLVLEEGQNGIMTKNLPPTRMDPAPISPHPIPDPSLTSKDQEKKGPTPTYSWALGIILEKNQTNPWSIQSVIHGSPAQRAGLKKGDKIIAVDSVVPKDLGGVKNLVRKAKSGDKIEVKVLRDGKEWGFSPVIGDWATPSGTLGE